MEQNRDIPWYIVDLVWVDGMVIEEDDDTTGITNKLDAGVYPFVETRDYEEEERADCYEQMTEIPELLIPVLINLQDESPPPGYRLYREYGNRPIRPRVIWHKVLKKMLKMIHRNQIDGNEVATIIRAIFTAICCRPNRVWETTVFPYTGRTLQETFDDSVRGRAINSNLWHYFERMQMQADDIMHEWNMQVHLLEHGNPQDCQEM